MSLVECAREARLLEERSRLRRSLAVKALAVTGHTQQWIADNLGITQPAVSQLLKGSVRVSELPPDVVIDAGREVVREVVESHGFSDAAIFGSVARGEAREDSDIDLLVRAPRGAQIADVTRLASALEQILGHHVDLVTYGALTPGLDDDIQRDAVLL